MKRHLALVLALVMVLTSFSFVSAAPDFSDMAGHANEDAVARLELLNVLKGYPDGTFKPDNTITRAEFAAVAVRISGLENVAVAAQGLQSGFTDVPAWHWASGYVGTAAQAGIVNGIGGGLFAPETPVKYEEAITMIVRALGYEPMAQARGGYPFGYLIVASEIDLLDGARGTQGTWATRGFVAQITDNALEIPMMVQVGFGTDVKWVVSGSREHDGEEVTLLERMGYEPFEGRVTGFSDRRNTVTLRGDDETKTFDVVDGFDFYEVDGVKIKVWVDGDDLVVAQKLQETVLFDAVKYDDDEDDEVTLVTLDDNYEVATGRDLVKFTVDGADTSVATIEADYAKVVINSDGEIVWLEGYTFDNFIVVEEVEDDVLYAYDGYAEEDVEDYDFVKGGKTIDLADVEEGDVVFLNYNAEFAVVYNSSEMGVVDRAYTNSFRMDGTIYDLAIGAVYLEDGDMDEVTSDVLEEFVDEGDDVEIFFNFHGDVVLMVGDRGTAATSTLGLFLETAANVYQQTRTGYDTLALDGVNSAGVSVSFDAALEDRDGTTDFYDDSEVDDKNANPWFAAETVIEYTIDEDGKLTKVIELEGGNLIVNDSFEISDRFAGGYRLKSSTVVFLLDDDYEVDEVFTFANAGDYFGEVTEYKVFADVDGSYAEYIVVYESDAATSIEEVGVVTRVRNLANGDKEVTINIAGRTYTFDVDATTAIKGDVVSFKINEAMDEISDLTVGINAGFDDIADVYGDVYEGDFELKNLRDRTFFLDTEGSLVFELDNAVILDATGTTKTIAFSAIENDDYVRVYAEGNSARGTVFVKYLVVVDAPAAPVVVDKAALVAIVAEAEEVNKELYTGASYTAFEDALALAVEMPEVTQAEVDAKVVAYQEAIDMLELLPFEGVVTFISENKMTMAAGGEVFTANANTRVWDGAALVGVGEFANIEVGDTVEIVEDVVTITAKANQ